jgi:hypothetical protein
LNEIPGCKQAITSATNLQFSFIAGEVKNYSKRVLWLEAFCHITGTLVGQMDVILSFLKGREPREVLKKTKDSVNSTAQPQADDSLNTLPGYCIIL